MELNQFGKIVEETWMSLPDHIKGIQIDEFIVMPNHFHGIVIINDMVVGAGSKPARGGSWTRPYDWFIRNYQTAKNIFSQKNQSNTKHTWGSCLAA